MSKSDVEIVNVSPPDMIPALDSGSVDAINIWQPYTYEAETRLGAKIRECLIRSRTTTCF
jgi:NitT/TauT family transport system substrate-binding protein